ncbi:MAG: hypothetical protein JSS27_02560 [Planctomycetes bacterium]|nr:hypothetical protein [Planctomycetota bacterium]
MSETTYVPSIAFPGIETPLAARVVWSHGVAPNRFTLELAPQEPFTTTIGDLTLGYSATTLVFPGCKVVSTAVRADEHGVVWVLELLDRRWRWQGLGQISGRYNIYQDTTNDGIAGTEIVAGSERTPRELLTLCLAALGETGYDLSTVPNDARPTVEWNYLPPAEALAELVDRLGCRVVVKLNNTVAVVPWGMGSALPSSASAQAGSLAVSLVARPDAFIVVGGPTRYQVDLALEPVGLDTDGSVRPIDDLSYAPSGGWPKADVPSFNTLADDDGRARELARATVYRWYRVCGMVSGVNPDGALVSSSLAPLGVTKLTQIVPLDVTQVDQQNVSDALAGTSAVLPRRAVVWGVWAELDYPLPRTDNADGNVVSAVAPLNETAGDEYAARARYAGAYTIDPGRAIVCFERPVYRWRVNGADYERLPASLVWRASFTVRDADTGALQRYERRRDSDGPALGTLPRYLLHDELTLTKVLRYASDYSLTSVADNVALLDAQADALLSAAEQAVAATSPQWRRYSGIEPIDLDGLVAMVVWSIDARGATTTASAGMELSGETQTQQAKRQAGRFSALWRQAQFTLRQRALEQRKAI